MAYGFLAGLLRDFAPRHEAWAASHASGKHFEARLAHVHGNLLALLNVVYGYLIGKLPVRGAWANWASWLSLAGLLMPKGILGEVYPGLSPVPVLAGAAEALAAGVAQAGPAAAA